MSVRDNQLWWNPLQRTCSFVRRYVVAPCAWTVFMITGSTLEAVVHLPQTLQWQWEKRRFLASPERVWITLSEYLRYHDGEPLPAYYAYRASIQVLYENKLHHAHLMVHKRSGNLAYVITLYKTTTEDGEVQQIVALHEDDRDAFDCFLYKTTKQSERLQRQKCLRLPVQKEPRDDADADADMALYKEYTECEL